MLARALRELASGRPVLLYDLDGREEETDMVVAGQAATPEVVSLLRREAGGLICLAIPSKVAKGLGLPYLHEVMRECGSKTLRDLSQSAPPYGGYPAFSITVNHADTYTGITDRDRSKTITELSALVGRIHREPMSNGWSDEFVAKFRSPGHLHLLIGSDLSSRKGHTELSLRLAELAGLDPAMTICEMLDARTHRALAKTDAAAYARKHRLTLVDAEEVLGGA